MDDMEVEKVEEAIITTAGEEEEEEEEEEEKLTENPRGKILVLWTVLLIISTAATFGLNFVPVLFFPDFAKLINNHLIFAFDWAVNAVSLVCMPISLVYFAFRWGEKAPGCVWGRYARSADLVFVVLVSLIVGYCSSRRDLDPWIVLGLASFNVQAHVFIKHRWKVLDYQVHDMMMAIVMQVFAYYNVVMLLHHGTSGEHYNGLGFSVAVLFVTMLPCGVAVFYTFSLDPVLDRPEDLRNLYRYDDRFGIYTNAR